MGRFIKVMLTEKMEADYKECVEMADDGLDKDCNGCSLSGGEKFECLGEYKWCSEA